MAGQLWLWFVCECNNRQHTLVFSSSWREARWLTGWRPLGRRKTHMPAHQQLCHSHRCPSHRNKGFGFSSWSVGWGDAGASSRNAPESYFVTNPLLVPDRIVVVLII